MTVLLKIQCKKIMALFEDNQPPSPQANESDKKLNIKSLRLYKALNWKNDFINPHSKDKLGRFFNGTKSFLTGNTYLPHCALALLGLIVAGTNINQRLAVEAYNKEMASINPDTMYSVSQSVDYYTPIINNDSALVEKVILAYNNPDGFASNTATIATEVTDRTDTVNKASDTAPDNSNSTIKYLVQNGDTLTGLGWRYGVKLATLKYVNNIDDEDLIKPGIEIKIPPRGYEVSAALIAKREKDNNAKLAVANRNTVTRNSTAKRTATVKAPAGSKVNAYPYGWCTYYVATRRAVPGGWGDAKAWLSSAQRAGYSTGKSPVVGAIMVSAESFWGHVAYVESVDGDSFTISEMNYKGWGVTSRRTIPIGAGFIRGFVY